LHGVPRLCDKFPGSVTTLAQEQTGTTHSVLQRTDKGKDCFSQSISPNYWETDFINTTSSPSSPALLTPANVAGERTSSGEVLRVHSPTQPEESLSLFLGALGTRKQSQCRANFCGKYNIFQCLMRYNHEISSIMDPDLNRMKVIELKKYFQVRGISVANKICAKKLTNLPSK